VSTEKKIKNSEQNKNQRPKTENQENVFIAWSDLLKNYKIPQEIPLDLVKGVLMDTTTKRYETFEELYVYCYRVASTVGLMSSAVLGYSDKIALRYAEAMGIGMQLTNILRDVKEDAEMGRIYLPQEDLKRFNVTEEQVFGFEFDDNFRELMKFQIARARDYYAKGEKGIPLLEEDSRFCVLFASRIYAKILDEIEKQDYDVFLKRAFTTRRQKLFAIPKIWRESRSM
jgi:phytoene synthase